MTSPLILTESDTIEALDSFEYVETPQRSLREGMLLVDRDLGTPVYTLDHRNPSTAPGTSAWFVADHENGGWTTVTLITANTYPTATLKIEV